MTIEEMITLAGICFCFYLFGRIHESIVSTRKHLKDITKAYEDASRYR
jgi:hypothetical protein